MILAKASLLMLASSLLISSSVHGATIIQTSGIFVAFNAEIGTIDDGPADGTKFDVMAPAGGSFSDYLSVESGNATVSFEVDFLDTEEYTVFVRYRESTNITPNIELTFDGATKGSPVYVSPSLSFAWVHLSSTSMPNTGSDFNPVNAPGVPETVTLSIASGSNFDIDAVALVSTNEINTNGFTVDDITVPEASLSVPEPSAALLLLTGPLLLLRRRRR